MKALRLPADWEPPDIVRIYHRKVDRKANPELSSFFYSLYDKDFCAEIKSELYRQVQATREAAGIVGVTFEAVEEKRKGNCLDSRA